MTIHADDLSSLSILSNFEARTSPDPFTATRLRKLIDDPACASASVIAKALGCLAETERFQSPDNARELAEEALRIARRGGEPDALLVALRVAVKIRWCPLQLHRLEELALELVELARSVESLPDLAQGISAQLFAATVRGQASVRRTRLAQLREICTLTDNPKIISHRLQHEAQLALASGHLDELERLVPAVAKVATESGDDVAIQSAMALALFYEWTAGLEGPGHELALVKAETDPWLIAWNIAVLCLGCEPGNETEVAAGLRRIISPDLDGLAPNALWLGQTVLIADIARYIGDSKLGAACRRILWPHRSLYTPLSGALCVGSTWFGVAAASAACGDVDRAIEEYDMAIEANERVGYRFWATASRGRQAELLYRNGRPGAARLVEEAIKQAKAMRLWPLVRTLESLEDTVLPNPLSRREQDVVDHLIGGKSNKEIAGTLYISVKTVERHLANISKKLGASSRLEIALWAADHRPLPTRAPKNTAR